MASDAATVGLQGFATSVGQTVCSHAAQIRERYHNLNSGRAALMLLRAKVMPTRSNVQYGDDISKLQVGWQLPPVEGRVKLLVQPDDGVKSVLAAVQKAKESLDIAIFRFDLKELEHALMDAIKRGVAVRALIACTNRGGEKTLRALESRLLEAGATVGRTADDLARYHGKFMIVDGRELYLLGFNFARADIRSRSFGLVVRNKSLVHEAGRLFTADSTRQPFSSTVKNLLVSPVNAREQLSRFIEGAKKSLCIYDPEISDPPMLRLLEECAKAGVDVRIIGSVPLRTSLTVRALKPMRLHVRIILRDEERGFFGKPESPRGRTRPPAGSWTAVSGSSHRQPTGKDLRTRLGPG